MRGEITSKAPTKEYRDGYDQIDWGRGKKESKFYSREECIFHYCPTPEECKSKGECLNRSRA